MKVISIFQPWAMLIALGEKKYETRSGNQMFGMTRAINEFHFGDYSEGRYAWELADVKQLPEPIRAKGQQGLWNWEGSHS